MDDIDSFLISHRNKLQTDKDNLNLPNNCMLINKKHEKPTKLNNKIIDENEFMKNTNGNRSKSAIMDFLQLNNNNAIEPLKKTTTTAAGGVGCVPEQLMQSPAIATTRSEKENMCSMKTSSMATTLPLPATTTTTTMATKQTQQVNRTPRGIIVESNFQICDNLGSRNYINLKHENNNCADKLVKNLTNLNEKQNSTDDSTNQKVVATSKYRVNKDDMEQWVTDTFYSYFPGFNNENKKRQDLLQDRQLEYQQNFIKHQMNEAAANSGRKKHSQKQQNHDDKQSTDVTHKTTQPSTTTTTTTPTSTSRSSDKTDLEIIVNNPDYEIKSPRPGSARYRHLQDLKHTDISNIVNNDGVTERNRRNAELEMAKKKDYQRELMAQIEEHKRSIELLKEKERRQEEAMTRKLEEQLKTMRLQEELEKEKMRADRMRFDSEQNRLMREHLLAKLETDTKALDASVRKTHSELSKISPAKNKVYKYFSNSARHEFRRDSPHLRQREQSAFHADVPQSTQCRRQIKKCFHDNDIDNDSIDSNVCPFCDSPLKSYESWCLKCEKRIFDSNSPRDETESILVCSNCKNLYSICLDCNENEGTTTNCCQRKTGCRKTLCSECIDAIAVRQKHKTDSERSFEILEVNYPEHDDDAANDLNNNPERNRPPYSINIDRNSIFHQDFDRSKLYNEEESIDEIRHQTDRQLSRYLKNYGDLACKGLRDRSTQTTPDSASRRDIVMVEENNLSMPLLREMPRMTRKESNQQQAERKKKGTRIENLARRWEVPAVQKHTMTTGCPKVLTQLGAIRKQLQSEQLHLDY